MKRNHHPAVNVSRSLMYVNYSRSYIIMYNITVPRCIVIIYVSNSIKLITENDCCCCAGILFKMVDV